MRPALAWIAVVCCACAEAGSLGRVPEGKWGGAHAALTVEQAGARVELDCAHGEATAPLLLDEGGRFDVPGYYVQEHGGPNREEEDDRRPARYLGSADEREVRLSIHLTDDSSTIGPFSMILGSPAQLVKCPSHQEP